MAEAVESQGTVLEVGDGADPEVFTQITGLQSINGPDGSANEIDTTDLSSAARETRPGIPDHGSYACAGKFDPNNAQHIQLQADYGNRPTAVRNYRVKYPSTPGRQFAFSAYVATFSASSEVDAIVGLSFSLRISGPNTLGNSV